MSFKTSLLVFLPLLTLMLMLIPSVSAINLEYNDSQIHVTSTDPTYDKNNIKTFNSQYWFGNQAADNLTISLADHKSVNRIQLYSDAGVGNRIYEVEIFNSDDNNTWNLVFNRTASYGEIANFTINSPNNFSGVTARFWRFQNIKRDNADNKGIIDFLQLSGTDPSGSIVNIVNTHDQVSISNFNVTWSNNTNTFTNSTTTFNAYYGDVDGLFNISIQKNGYFNKTFNNINVTENNNFQADISLGTINITTTNNGYNTTIKDTVTGNVMDSNETNNAHSLLFLNGNTTSNITLLITKDGFANYTTSFINNGSDKFFNINLYANPSILNVTLRDELTRQVIDSNIFLTVVGNNNYTNSTGTIYASNLTPGDYEITYGGDDFFLRRYYINIVPDSFSNLELYLLNTSTTNAALVNYEVVDENGVIIKNATVKLLRFYPSINQELLVEMSKSDTNGEGGFHLQRIDPEYSFIVEKDGVTLLDTSRAQVFTTSLIIRAEVLENVVGSTVLVANLNSSISYNESTGSFTLSWNDPTNTVLDVCFNVTKIRSSGIILINDTCVTGSAGSITLGAEGNNTNGLYRAWSRIETNTENSPHIIEFLEKTRSDLLAFVGEGGTFYAALLIMAFALTGLAISRHPAGVLFGAIIGYVGSGLIGLMDITFAAVIFAIVIVGLIIFGSRRGV